MGAQCMHRLCTGPYFLLLGPNWIRPLPVVRTHPSLARGRLYVVEMLLPLFIRVYIVDHLLSVRCRRPWAMFLELDQVTSRGAHITCLLHSSLAAIILCLDSGRVANFPMVGHWQRGRCCQSASILSFIAMSGIDRFAKLGKKNWYLDIR
ncbi:uncharacterized protein C8Q71DRAFT_737932 [Rhodofomes roseus]|uniref:Uncharacterized protein n=1 Tax=Rhodofomes roseus TaxID=34475 RepID=A0ABQ8KST5_9APHY|nr:uncharacterized protein C8Q71DRAFT_737932 [Rhodofomes roseus]KAH9841619.1 hypothetical protein C8Q71DRAFT_737932 [Rhodofomes roseus]